MHAYVVKAGNFTQFTWVSCNFKSTGSENRKVKIEIRYDVYISS